jgi:FemAB-related protein (PEP-CTERM system-associated)
LLIEQKLMDAASNLAKSIGTGHIEYRDEIVRNSLPVRTDKVNMILSLPESEGHLWDTFPSKLRSQIRRAQREKVQVNSGGIECLADFYTVFAQNMRDLGTPVYGKVLFENILQTFPEGCRIINVHHEGRPVASAFLLRYKETLEIPWASTIKDVNHLSINMLLYWEVLKFAIKNRCQYFDFGRSSKGSGTFRFKQQWGAKPKPSYWHYWLPDDVEMPKLNPENPKYLLAISIWKKLPVFLTKILGPKIVRNLP